MALSRADIEEIASRAADQLMERIREPVETCQVEIASIPENGEDRAVAFLTCLTRELKSDGNVHPLGNPHVRLEEDLFQYIRGQMRPQESMSQTIARLAKGERFVEENLLTPTQYQVLALTTEGLSTREVAERLGISPGTVLVHLMDIRRLIGVRTTEEAVAAFGKPTERERVPFAVLREPRPQEERIVHPEIYEKALSYEHQAASLLTLVDEIEKQPSMEKLGRLEKQVLDLAKEVDRARAQAPIGRESQMLGNLHKRLLDTIEHLTAVRSSLELMEREGLPPRAIAPAGKQPQEPLALLPSRRVAVAEVALPLRKEAAERSFLSAIRVLRENLLGWSKESPHEIAF